MPRPQQMHLVPLSYMVSEAIEFIRANEPPEGYFVAFSGGKDSIVTLELTRMAGVKHSAYYSTTGIDPPEVVQFIRTHYPDVKWLHPKKSFFQLIQVNDPPIKNQRWCCKYLKKNVSKSIKLKHRLMGLRSEESIARAGRPRIDYVEKRKEWHYKPIFDWKEWHIWDFIGQHGLAYPSLYDDGFHRVGCIVCPFICSKNMRQVIRNKNRWPGVYKAFEHAVTRWFDSKRKGHDKDFENADQYLQAYYRGFE